MCFLLFLLFWLEKGWCVSLDFEQLGKQLKLLRESKGITKQQLAQYLNWPSSRGVTAAERGHFESFQDLYCIFDVLGFRVQVNFTLTKKDV